LSRNNENFGPALNSEQVEELLLVGTPEAREQVLKSYLGWIKLRVSEILTSTALGRAAQKRFDHFDDAEQEARIALYKCTESFDPDRGISFTYWATRPVRWAIITHLSEFGGPIKAVGTRSMSHGPRNRELAWNCFDAPSYDDQPTLIENHKSPGTLPEEAADNSSMADLIDRLLDEKMPEDEARAVRNYYMNEMSLREASEAGPDCVAYETIRLRRNRGLEKMSKSDALREYWEDME